MKQMISDIIYELFNEELLQFHKYFSIAIGDEVRFKPTKIIFNHPATIVFWEDGSKTVVKCRKGTEFDPYYGFTCALAKKVYGNNSQVNRIVNQAILKSFEKGGNQK